MEVEIWSDIACPWCYIGKRRFEAALAQFEHKDDVRVTWRSFELDPSAPRERGEWSITGRPKLGASATLTLRGMTVSKTMSGKWRRSSCSTS